MKQERMLMTGHKSEGPYYFSIHLELKICKIMNLNKTKFEFLFKLNKIILIILLKEYSKNNAFVFPFVSGDNQSLLP